MTTRYGFTQNQDDELRIATGYPVKTFQQGSMLTMETARSTHRLRPSTAPAGGRLHTQTLSRTERTGKAYNNLVNFLDKTGRLYQPGTLTLNGKGLQETARPSKVGPFLDESPQAKADRLAWAQYARYRSEYQESFGEPLLPPDGVVSFPTQEATQRPMSAIQFGSAGGRTAGGFGATGRTQPRTKPIPHSRPDIANRHSHHCGIYNPAHHISHNQFVGRFTGVRGSTCNTVGRGGFLGSQGYNPGDVLGSGEPYPYPADGQGYIDPASEQAAAFAQEAR